MLKRAKFGAHAVESKNGGSGAFRSQYFDDGVHGVIVSIIHDVSRAIALDFLVMLGRRRGDNIRVSPVFEDLDRELADRTARTPYEDRSSLFIRGEGLDVARIDRGPICPRE